ncbi:unnamed protein product, partial [marine sediment metagenome]
TMRHLDEGARLRVLGDFARARRHISWYLGTKLNLWNRLPWSLFGAAHWGTGVAVRCARRSLALYA